MYEERVSEWWGRKELINVFKYSKGRYVEEILDPLFMIPGQTTREL